MLHHTNLHLQETDGESCLSPKLRSKSKKWRTSHSDRVPSRLTAPLCSPAVPASGFVIKMFVFIRFSSILYSPPYPITLPVNTCGVGEEKKRRPYLPNGKSSFHLSAADLHQFSVVPHLQHPKPIAQPSPTNADPLIHSFAGTSRPRSFFQCLRLLLCQCASHQEPTSENRPSSWYSPYPRQPKKFGDPQHPSAGYPSGVGEAFFGREIGGE
jgi:hypothetical protein